MLISVDPAHPWVLRNFVRATGHLYSERIVYSKKACECALFKGPLMFCDQDLEQFSYLANIFLSSFTGNTVCEPNSDLLQKYKNMSNYEKEYFHLVYTFLDMPV